MSTHAVAVSKYHGTGNDFFVVDASARVTDRAAFARAHCDRETGATPTETATATATTASTTDEHVDTSGRRGADGVLFLSIETRYRPTRVVMTLVQPDGSTADMCGNGARVVARWAADQTGEQEFMIDTQAGTRHATVAPSGDRVTVEMGTPRFDPAAVPADSEEPLIETDVAGRTVTAVDTGVPHAVSFVDSDTLASAELSSVAPPTRHADVFPDGANVSLAAIRADGRGDGPAVIDQRTFERGVEGETQSCGTGAVAVVAAAKRTGRIAGDDEKAVTRPPGGELEIVVPDDGRATLTGPVAHEYAGQLPADPR